jgi:hypothetical protein
MWTSDRAEAIESCLEPQQCGRHSQQTGLVYLRPDAT